MHRGRRPARPAGRGDRAARTAPAPGDGRLHPVRAGQAGGDRPFPGSVGLPGRALEAAVSSAVGDLLRQGFRSVAVLNGHFENSWTLLEAVEQAIEPYRETHRALLIHWWDQVGTDDVQRIF